ncbi:MAG TPA: F0F1 ATP synthase subunit A [Amoebophilaceae bacterium]|nr:F0F1 ATP synthase subunit A [Amoebophilaceae bacterium]
MAMGICFPTRAAATQDHTNDFLMEHITDAHSWHFATFNNHVVTLPLPVILYSSDRGLECFSSARFYGKQHELIPFRGYVLVGEKIRCLDPGRSVLDFSITKNIAAMWGSLVCLIGLVLWAARRYQQYPLEAPKGFFSLMDGLISFIKNKIALPNIGQKHYERFLPYLLTIFFFIWINNLLGLLPGGANVTGNISVALVLAAFTTLVTVFSGNKHYWMHIFNPPGIPKWLLPILIPIEILGILTRFFSLMIRLFANITAGHIILLSIIGLVFSAKNVYAGLGIGFVISVPFGTFMFFLKLLAAWLQAYVFTLLSAIYFGQAVAESKH